jgi:hypothetical protein
MAEPAWASQDSNSHQDRGLGLEGDRATAAQEPSQVGVSREPTEAHSLLYSETFAARAVRDGVWVGDLEAAFLQVFAVIEHRAADKKRAFWIDNQPHIRDRHQNIALLRAIHQIHDVLQSRASTADHRQAQRSVRVAFFLKQRRQFAGRGLRNSDQAFVTNLIVSSRCLCSHSSRFGLVDLFLRRGTEQFGHFVLHGFKFIQAQLRIGHDKHIASCGLLIDQDAPLAIAGLHLHLF